MRVRKRKHPLDGSCMEVGLDHLCDGEVFVISIEGSNLITEIRLCQIHLTELQKQTERLLPSDESDE